MGINFTHSISFGAKNIFSWDTNRYWAGYKGISNLYGFLGGFMELHFIKIYQNVTM